ncbi:MAG: glutamine--tRNA ligase [Clostridiales bacterium]|nr:glutamine--tRNA ligase [Clostridiales bacterium]
METAENFIEEIVEKDLSEGRVAAVWTRHPPEPSGYLHIGHVRNIYLNYGIAQKYGGVCNLRFDDTNPGKEEREFVDAIMADVKWLGYRWQNVYHATDYFQQNYEIAVRLIRAGKAFVCDLSPEELSASRGTLTAPGTDSPFRNRSVDENLVLFAGMKAGAFPPGARALRAKIDMAHPNMNMRDPVIYRIQLEPHHRIGRSWNIYPTYDFSHPLDDALEGVTHSICGPEFEDHRPLYNWVVENSGLQNRPRQIEYANLYLEGTVLGKRNIKKLVKEGAVDGFDDPRLYTISGLRRRGVLPESLLNFVRAAGIAKGYVVQQQSFLDFYIRETLNERALRVMAVLDPVRLTLTNLQDGEEREVFLADYPQRETSSKRRYTLSNELLIERGDFAASPPPGFHRLYPGNTVRLMGVGAVTCTGFRTDPAGAVDRVFAELVEEPPKKIKATIHWINAKSYRTAAVKLLGSLTNGTGGEDGVITVNPDSLQTKTAYLETAVPLSQELRYQFVRNGYFALDCKADPAEPVFIRTITLK